MSSDGTLSRPGHYKEQTVVAESAEPKDVTAEPTYIQPPRSEFQLC